MTEVEEIIDELEIEIQNIFHFILIGGVEVMGEIVDTENGEIVLCNPIKILVDSWLSDDDYKTQHFFVEWNPCGAGPYAHINSGAIVSKAVPNNSYLNSYLQALYDQYFPDVISVELESNNDESSSSNVIRFESYTT